MPKLTRGDFVTVPPVVYCTNAVASAPTITNLFVSST